MTVRYLALVCAGICLAFALEANAQRPDLERQKAAFEAAQSDPSDDKALAAYLATLPRHRNLSTGELVYLVEGDLPRTALEVRAYLSARKEQPTQPVDNLELKLHRVLGVPMCWAAQELRIIRYAVHRSSFESSLNDGGVSYNKVVDAMKGATDDWEKVCPECGIKFVHVAALDNPPGSNDEQVNALFNAVADDRIRFFVYYEASDPRLYARAFFPNDSADRRTVLVAQATLDTFAPGRQPNSITARGVLRHELGHVLGYRHEHIEAPYGCNKEPDKLHVPANITLYDKKSVMHYDCGPSATKGDDVISDLDKAGHRKVYGPQMAGHMCGLPIAGFTRTR